MAAAGTETGMREAGSVPLPRKGGGRDRAQFVVADSPRKSGERSRGRDHIQLPPGELVCGYRPANGVPVVANVG